MQAANGAAANNPTKQSSVPTVKIRSWKRASRATINQDGLTTCQPRWIVAIGPSSSGKAIQGRKIWLMFRMIPKLR